MGWNIYVTNTVIGVLVIIYTASGGSKAVSWTQTQQMIIIMTAMVGAFFIDIANALVIRGQALLLPIRVLVFG